MWRNDQRWNIVGWGVFLWININRESQEREICTTLLTSKDTIPNTLITRILLLFIVMMKVNDSPLN